MLWKTGLGLDLGSLHCGSAQDEIQYKELQNRSLTRAESTANWGIVALAEVWAKCVRGPSPLTIKGGSAMQCSC